MQRLEEKTMYKKIRFILTFIRVFKNTTMIIEYEERLSSLEAATKIQCLGSSHDSTNNQYMHGVANGMALAVSMLKNEAPKFIDVDDFQNRRIDDDEIKVGGTE